MATNNTSSTSSRSPASPFKPPGSAKDSSAALTPKPSKRKSKKKSSKSSSKGQKKTKFCGKPSRHRRRRFPSGTSASSRRRMRPSQLSFGHFPAFFQRRPLLVPSISSFYPPGASPLAPGTPVNIPGLPPLIAGNPVPLPPGAFQPSPFLGVTPATAGFAFPFPTGGGGTQQPIVLPFPIPMPMPMPSQGASQAPIVIPAPPPAPPAPAPPIPYPIPAPVAPQGGGGGSDSMAMMMMMKAMQQDRQAATDQRERENEEREDRKRDEERRERKKEKEEEKKRRKKEKEEERKRRKEEREKAMEEQRKAIEKLEEENRRQIEEAQKQAKEAAAKAEEAAAKKKAEKEEALAKKAAEEEEAKKKKEKEEEEEKEKQKAAEKEKAEVTSGGDHPKDSPVADPVANVASPAVEEHPLMGEQPYPGAYQAPHEAQPALDPDLNPALQMTEPSSSGRILCFILFGLIAFLAIVIGLLYVFAPGMLPFLPKTTGAATKTTAAGSLRAEVDGIDSSLIEGGELPSVVLTTRNSSASTVVALKARLSTRERPEGTMSIREANTIEIALNDQHWAGAGGQGDKGRSSTPNNADFWHNFDNLSPRSPLPLYDVTENTTVDVTRKEVASSIRPVRRHRAGSRGQPVTALTLGAFLDRNYRANLKARLFAEDASENGALGQVASQRSHSAYADIWGDGEEDKAVTSFTFEASTKSAIRQLLENVHNANRPVEELPEHRAWRTSAQMSDEAQETWSENANAVAAELANEIETLPEHGLTLEDFKVYNAPGINLFGSEFERTFGQLKRAKVKPLK